MRWATLATAALLAGCPASLEQEAEEALGPEVGDPGPTHRPNQPCLVCHSDRHNPGNEVFALAGTVYERITDTQGLFGAEVRMTDDTGETFSVLTNEAGNFMARFDPDVDAPEEDEFGRVLLPFEPVFPVRVEVRRGANSEEMRNVIGRDGSCAACHTDPPGATSNGRVFVME